MTRDETAILLMGEKIPANPELRDVHELRFLPDNPRVYAAIREMQDFSELTPEEQQLRIYERLLEEPSVKNLIPQIKQDGGLHEPVTVREDTRQVVEGNSRLAVYRKFSHERPGDDRWTQIKCRVVKSLTSAQQTRLLAQVHLHGKTDWSKYAISLSCFRWVEEDKKDISDLAELYGITAAEIVKNVKAIQLMLRNNDSEPSHISSYDLLIRHKVISPAVADNKPLEDTILSQIKAGKIKALQMRDRLPVIISKRRTLKKYQEGVISLEEAWDDARISDVQQQLKRIRALLDNIEQGDITRLDRSELNAIKQTVRQAERHMKRISGMVEKELDTISSKFTD